MVNQSSSLSYSLIVFQKYMLTFFVFRGAVVTDIKERKETRYAVNHRAHNRFIKLSHTYTSSTADAALGGDSFITQA